MALALLASREAFVLALIAATAWAAGGIGLRVAGVRAMGVPAGVTIGVGLALLAQVALILGLFAWLTVPVLWLVVLLVHLAAIGSWWPAGMVGLRAALRTPRRTLIVGTVVLALAAPFFLLTLYPPLGFDQTLYHLPTSRAFAASGGVPFLPTLRYPVFPSLAEVLNAAVLLLAGDVATQLVGWLALVACLGLVFAWARDLSSRAGGWMAVATLAGSPIAFYLASTGYVEPLVALFGSVALYAVVRGRQESRVAWIVLGGVMAGSAAGAKYLGLFFVPAGAVLLLSNGPWKVTLRQLALYGVAVALALAPSYGRILAHTGNPLFPFYPEIFGDSPWAAQELLGQRGMDRLFAASTLLWDMTFRRQTVGAMPPFSPAFVFGLPVVLAAAWSRPALRRLLILAVGYVLVAPVHAHYVLGIAPLWSVLLGSAAAILFERRGVGTRALLVVAIALAFGGEAYAVYRVGHLGWPPTTDAGRAELLAAEHPMYPAIVFLNRVDGRAVVYGIGAENMVDYATGTLLGDVNGPASYSRIEARVRAGGSLAEALDEIGVSYLLLPSRPSVWTQWAVTDPRLQRVYSDSRASVYRVVRAAVSS